MLVREKIDRTNNRADELRADILSPNSSTLRSLEVSDWMQIIRRANLSLTLDGDEAAMSEAALLVPPAASDG